MVLKRKNKAGYFVYNQNLSDFDFSSILHIDIFQPFDFVLSPDTVLFLDEAGLIWDNSHFVI